MLEFPPVPLDDLDSWADWVELCTLLEEGGFLSTSVLAGEMRDAGLVGLSRGDVFPGDGPTFRTEVDFSDEDEAERFTAQVWDRLRARSQALNGCYPFNIHGDVIEGPSGGWRSFPAFTLMLAIDAAKSYGKSVDTAVKMNQDTVGSMLFEKIVEASFAGIAAGVVCRFGWPQEPGWPTPINERVAQLAGVLGRRVERLDGKTRANDKDRGLDVAWILRLGDGDNGSLAVLTQCAVGDNWNAKRGEPAIAEWSDLLDWNVKLLRGVAVPWRLREPWTIYRTHRHFDGALVLDRPRLVACCPDSRLDVTVKARIIEWCRKNLLSFPRR